MKKIGEGWQYSVYDLNNGRVLKKFHSPLKSYWVILKTTFQFRDDPLMLIPDFSRSMKAKAIASFEILKRKDIPASWIGNPRFINDFDFEQDKARPLHDVFSVSNTSEIKDIIDKFIIFNKELLGKGIIDKSFNITKNYGLNTDGDIVLIDIGELFDDPERIKIQLKNQAWNKNYVAGCIQNEEAREYFIKEMNQKFCYTYPMNSIFPVRENLELRILEPRDAQALFDITQKNKQYFKQWLGWLDDDRTVEDTEKYIIESNKRLSNKEGVDFAIFYEGKQVGGIGLYPWDSAHKKTSIGYWLVEEMQGKGIMTDSLKVALNYAFEEMKLNRIEISCAIGNIKSSALPKKLGFTLEGISREGNWLYNHFVDLEVYSLLAKEWKK